MTRIVCNFVGTVSTAIGLVGFADPEFMGMHLTAAHNLLHLAAGIGALIAGFNGTLLTVRNTCLGLGLVYGLLAVAGFIFGPGPYGLLTLVPGQFVFDRADHIIHLILGVPWLIAGAATRIPSNRVAPKQDGVVLM